MKRYICAILTVFMTGALMCGCTTEETVQLNTRDFVAMDTVFTLKTGDIAAETGIVIDSVFDECEKLVSDIENVLSPTLAVADVYNFNGQVNAFFDADPVFTEVLSFAIEISELTNGTYDPTVGALTSLWNVKGGGPVPSAEQIEAALVSSGTELIEIKDDAVYKTDQAVKIDLGGIGKGYAAQKLAEYLFEFGVSYGIVSAGRTVGVFGDKPDGELFKIGIADPADTEAVVGYIYTGSGFVSVAGDYEQFFISDGIKYHHIIDPDTGYPSDSGLTSVAVLAQNGAAADALSTALMVMGYDEGMELYNSGKISFEAVFIGTDGSVMLTDGMTEEKFELDENYRTADNSESSTFLSTENHGTDSALDTESEISGASDDTETAESSEETEN